LVESSITKRRERHEAPSLAAEIGRVSLQQQRARSLCDGDAVMASLWGRCFVIAAIAWASLSQHFYFVRAGR